MHQPSQSYYMLEIAKCQMKRRPAAVAKISPILAARPFPAWGARSLFSSGTSIKYYCAMPPGRSRRGLLRDQFGETGFRHGKA